MTLHPYYISLGFVWAIFFYPVLAGLFHKWYMATAKPPRGLVALRGGVTCPTRLTHGRAIPSSLSLSLLCQCSFRACILMWNCLQTAGEHPRCGQSLNVLCGSRDATEVSSKLKFSLFLLFLIELVGLSVGF